MRVVANIEGIAINDRPYISRPDSSIPHDGAGCGIKGKYLVKSPAVCGAGCHVGHIIRIGHTRLLVIGSSGSGLE